VAAAAARAAQCFVICLALRVSTVLFIYAKRLSHSLCTVAITIDTACIANAPMRFLYEKN
jgi:hypothetical protein